VSTPEVAGVVGGLPIPVGSVPVIAVVIAIGVAVMVVAIVVISSPQDEISATALVDPHPIAMSSPRAPFNTWLLPVLPYHAQIVRIPVSGNLALLALPIGRAVESLCIRKCTGKKQDYWHKQ
jgi:hypothetical protein